MKSFEEFWNTLTEDDFALMCEKTNEATKNIRENSSAQTLLGNQVGITTVLTSKFILEKYHNWLFEQLQ